MGTCQKLKTNLTDTVLPRVIQDWGMVLKVDNIRRHRHHHSYY